MNIIDELKKQLGELASIKIGIDEFGYASIEAMVMVEPVNKKNNEETVNGTSYGIHVGVDCELGVDNVTDDGGVIDPWCYLADGLNDELAELKNAKGDFVIGDR